MEPIKSHQLSTSENSFINSDHKNTQLKTSTRSLNLLEVRDVMRQFIDERDWHHFHTPRNLLIALVGEVGEVSEIFQWKSEVTRGLPELSQKQKIHVGEQLADVLSYLIRLSDVCGIDLSQAFLDKVQKNKKKYPKEIVKGSSKKYSEYKQNAKQENNKEKENIQEMLRI